MPRPASKSRSESAQPLPRAIFLMGPTASGKTDLAVELHERFAIDIISVDSALVYRGMDIGTAKPDAATLARAPHALIDIRDPAESYSAAEFRADALAQSLRMLAADPGLRARAGEAARARMAERYDTVKQNRALEALLTSAM